ncbi:GNAT family N-acetyltransferase [Myxococcaceae bacterium GXIMD 01537]
MDRGEAHEREGLASLLMETVAAGASVGFLAPLQASASTDYWAGVLSSLGPGLALWVAEQNGHIVGSIQLALCQKANGLHRAEVQKLIVHPGARGQGISSKLLDELERFARSQGRFLLVLDTETGSHAETVYQHLGWQRAGEIPDYARSADGVLHSTTYYFKRLAP